jgi:lipopolysaccharide assembly outer membrane protein LptD (OstA)
MTMKKWPLLLLVVCLGLLGQNRQIQDGRVALRIQGAAMEFSYQKPTGEVVLLKTRAARTLTISADAMIFHEDTGEIEATGDVRVKVH